MTQKPINKYIISELDDSYEFVWTGVDLEDETQILENDKMKSEAGFVSQGDMFLKHTGRKFDPNNDIILNQVYQQAQQAKMMGGEESNAAVDEMTGEQESDNVFEEFGKGESSDPITEGAMKYMNKLMNT